MRTVYDAARCSTRTMTMRRCDGSEYALNPRSDQPMCIRKKKRDATAAV